MVDTRYLHGKWDYLKLMNAESARLVTVRRHRYDRWFIMMSIEGVIPGTQPPPLSETSHGDFYLILILYHTLYSTVVASKGGIGKCRVPWAALQI